MIRTAIAAALPVSSSMALAGSPQSATARLDAFLGYRRPRWTHRICGPDGWMSNVVTFDAWKRRV